MTHKNAVLSVNGINSNYAAVDNNFISMLSEWRHSYVHCQQLTFGSGVCDNCWCAGYTLAVWCTLRELGLYDALRGRCGCMLHFEVAVAVLCTLRALSLYYALWGRCGCIMHFEGVVAVWCSLRALWLYDALWGRCGFIMHFEGVVAVLWTLGGALAVLRTWSLYYVVLIINNGLIEFET